MTSRRHSRTRVQAFPWDLLLGCGARWHRSARGRIRAPRSGMGRAETASSLWWSLAKRCGLARLRPAARAGIRHHPISTIKRSGTARAICERCISTAHNSGVTRRGNIIPGSDVLPWLKARAIIVLLFSFDFLGVLVLLLSLFVLEFDDLFVVTVIVAVVVVVVMLHDMDGNRM